MGTDKPVDHLPLSRREGHGCYPPTKAGEEHGVLTWRLRETDPRVAIPRAQWSLERLPIPKSERGAAGALGSGTTGERKRENAKHNEPCSSARRLALERQLSSKQPGR
jgi:hypothetical protein